MTVQYGERYEIPLGITPTDSTNPFFAVAPDADYSLRIVRLHLISGGTALTITKKLLRATATAMAGTAITAPYPKSPGTTKQFTALANAAVAVTALFTGSTHTIQASTGNYLDLEPDALDDEIHELISRVVTLAVGTPPLDVGATILVVANGVTHTFECGTGTNTATKRFFAPGADYTAGAANLAAAMNLHFGVSTVTAAAGAVTVPKVLGKSLLMSSVVEGVDAGGEIVVTDGPRDWWTLTASATTALSGFVVVEQRPVSH